jgi:hypothetical protein
VAAQFPGGLDRDTPAKALDLLGMHATQQIWRERQASQQFELADLGKQAFQINSAGIRIAMRSSYKVGTAAASRSRKCTRTKTDEQLDQGLAGCAGRPGRSQPFSPEIQPAITSSMSCMTCLSVRPERTGT